VRKLSSNAVLVLALAGIALLTPLAAGVSPYYYDILVGIAINVILAVSLNLINGDTGQFSLGHAGGCLCGRVDHA